MEAGAVSASAGSAHVALWGNGAVPSALKCHETGTLLCVCVLVGILQTYTYATESFAQEVCPIGERHDMGKHIAIIQGHPDASVRPEKALVGRAQWKDSLAVSPEGKV